MRRSRLLSDEYERQRAYFAALAQLLGPPPEALLRAHEKLRRRKASKVARASRRRNRA